MSRAGQRKTRADKKRDVKPLISVEVKDAIYRISHITHTPIKDVCEFLIVDAAKDREVINGLSKFFKRSIRIDSTIILGDINATPVSKKVEGNREAVSVKFRANDFELISALAYALDCTPTRAAAILLTINIRSVRAVNEYVKNYLSEELSKSQLDELRQLLTYIHRNSDDNHSWATVLSTIVGDVRPAMRSLSELVSEFIDRYRS